MWSTVTPWHTISQRVTGGGYVHLSRFLDFEGGRSVVLMRVLSLLQMNFFDVWLPLKKISGLRCWVLEVVLHVLESNWICQEWRQGFEKSGASVRACGGVSGVLRFQLRRVAWVSHRNPWRHMLSHFPFQRIFESCSRGHAKWCSWFVFEIVWCGTKLWLPCLWCLADITGGEVWPQTACRGSPYSHLHSQRLSSLSWLLVLSNFASFPRFCLCVSRAKFSSKNYKHLLPWQRLWHYVEGKTITRHFWRDHRSYWSVTSDMRLYSRIQNTLALFPIGGRTVIPSSSNN
jgi:hypothetical protein